MPKTDETIALLTEIRDLQRQQLSLQKAALGITQEDDKRKMWMTVFHALYNAAIVVFVIAAFWYFYHSLYTLV